jgi:hypothetical protein
MRWRTFRFQSASYLLALRRCSTHQRRVFEAGFAAAVALAFTDIMLPMRTDPKHPWRIVEVKSSTSVKNYHRDDIAIQAFVVLAAGVNNLPSHDYRHAPQTHRQFEPRGYRKSV